MQQPLLTEIDQGVGIITLNRAEQRNAFDAAVVQALTEALVAMDSDASVRVVVLSSTGSFFCAGADLRAMQQVGAASAEQNLADARALAAMLRILAEFGKPTIARIQGPAYGGGVGLVAACDIAIATYEAQFALSEVRFGLLPATISPHVIAAIGARAARRYMLTAEPFGATEAYRLGLVHEIVADEQALDDAVGEIVAALLANAPQALGECKALIRHVAAQAFDARLEEHTAQCIARVRASAEAAEGIAAFLAKRPPAWKID